MLCNITLLLEYLGINVSITTNKKTFNRVSMNLMQHTFSIEDVFDVTPYETITVLQVR